MIGAKPIRLSFSPALPCVNCRELITQGLIYPMSPQVWHLLPLCNKDIEEPVPAGEEEPFASIGSLQRRRRRTARAYMGLRRQHTHVKAQRALRWRLRRICQRQEVWRD